MQSSSIPTFGSVNGVSGSPTSSTALASIATPVAVMYNYYDSALMTQNANSILTNSVNRIVLNAYTDASNTFTDPDTSATTFPMENFLNLFFPTNSGYFNVNPANSNNPCILLSKQTYTSSNSKYNKFSLVQELLKAYCDNNGLNINDLDPRIMLLLQKECFTCQSLASIKGTTLSLSWDEVMNTLIRSGMVETAGTSTDVSYAAVPLQIVLNYHSFVLNTDLSIVFTYYVDILGYTIPTTPPAQQTLNCASDSDSYPSS
jgi:hypothetical protein